MGFFTTSLNLVLVAMFTGAGVALGQALYKKYIEHHIHKLPAKETNNETTKNITTEDLKEFIKKIEEQK